MFITELTSRITAEKANISAALEHTKEQLDHVKAEAKLGREQSEKDIKVLKQRLTAAEDAVKVRRRAWTTPVAHRSARLTS